RKAFPLHKLGRPVVHTRITREEDTRGSIDELRRFDPLPPRVEINPIRRAIGPLDREERLPAKAVIYRDFWSCFPGIRCVIGVEPLCIIVMNRIALGPRRYIPRQKVGHSQSQNLAGKICATLIDSLKVPGRIHPRYLPAKAELMLTVNPTDIVVE